jgi:scyllo-inositol 2-dehydrogenase (NADP+)
MISKTSLYMKVALVGYGLAGSAFHAPIIETVAGLTLKSIVSSRKDEIIKHYPHVAVVPQVEQVLSDKAIDLVVIATPTNTHYDLVSSALLAGKHVLVDKPFVVTSSEAETLADLASKQNKALIVYQNRRFDGDFLTVKQLLSEGRLGKLYYFESHFDRFRPLVDATKWREQDKPGSGILYDLGAHLIDQALCLFGKPQWLIADIAKQRHQAAIDDYFHIILGYSTLRVVLHSSSVVKAPGPRFILHGDQGSFVKYGLDPQEQKLKQGAKPDQDAHWGKEPESMYGTLSLVSGDTPIETLAGNYPLFYQQVYNALVTGTDFPVTLAQACDLIKIIELVKQSASEGALIRL